MLVLLVLVLLISPSALAEKSNPQKGNTGDQASEPKQNPANPANTAIGECVNCFDVQAPDSEREKQDTYDARSDSLYRWYLRATIIGVGGALFGLAILILQTIATHKAADAAKASADAVINSERAWIQAKIDTFHPLSNWTPPPHFPFIWMRVHIKNYGRTPATVTKIVARAHVIPKGEGVWPPRLPSTPVYEPVPANPHVVIHEREMTLLPRQQYPIVTEITDDDLHSIKAKESMLYVYGFIDYLDLSGAKRQTRFCKLYWIPAVLIDPNDEGFMESTVIPAAYTKST